MIYKPIIIVAGEPNSIFFEIFFKALKYKKFKSPIILIASLNLLKLQMKKLKIKKNINLINFFKLKEYKLNNKSINLININYNQQKPFEKISSKSNRYIEQSFKLAIKILQKKITNKFINGSISKKFFLKNKFPGMTEYFAAKVKKKNKAVMLIYNDDISVSPITTHMSLRKIFGFITKKKIVSNLKIINNFYKKYLNKVPKFGITGINPHCESSEKYSEEEKIIIPAINTIKKNKIKISGPFPADTIFLKKNYEKYDVIVGMYHDQVLTPLKTLYEFNAINITIGLPFIRITVDHGPNNKMIGKNLSSPTSFVEILNFVKNLRDI